MFERFKKQGVDWIVVFLGNPGKKYENTRHNVGFKAAEFCEKQHNCKIMRSQFQALTAKIKISGQNVLLLKPQTYMNLSGNSASEAARYFKVPADHVIVLSDDVALPLGSLRVRTKGSAGGHNGLKSIIDCLGTNEFPRVKIGVGSPADNDMVDWVLGALKGQDAIEASKATQRAWKAVETYITDGAEKAMQDYN